MRWEQADTEALDKGGGVWHSGHVSDVIVQGERRFLAADTGNVWLVQGTDAPVVLSDLEAPRLTRLASGPDGPDHIFACGGEEWGFSAPKVVARDAASADVFAIGSERALWHFPLVSGRWLAPQLLGGDILNSVAVTSVLPRIDVFAVGFDRQLYHKWTDGPGWLPSAAPFEQLGGVIVGSPAAVNTGDGQIHVLVLGVDNALHHKRWDGTRWIPSADGFDRLGGSFGGAPVAVATGAGRLAVFGVERTSGSLMVAHWIRGRWSRFTNLGGRLLAPPAITSLGDGTIDVVAVLSHALPNYQRFDGKVWNSGWEPIGSEAVRAVSAARCVAKRLDVVVVGNGGALQHKTLTQEGWDIAWTDTGDGASGVPSLSSNGPNLHLAWDADWPAGALRHRSWSMAEAHPGGEARKLPAVTMGALHVTDTTAADRLRTWINTLLPLAAGRVWDLVVHTAGRRAIVATDHGVWWSPIPPAASARGGYVWRQAEGLPDSRFSAVALGPFGRLAAAAWGVDISGGGHGLFTGAFSGDNLRFRRAHTPGVDTRTMTRISLASCASRRFTMYAIACDPYPISQNDRRWLSYADRPVVISRRPATVDVFSRSAEAALHHGWWDESQWQWEDLGGVLPSAPAAAAFGAGHMLVVTVGTDRRLRYRVWEGVSWSGWISLASSGAFVGGPAACAPASGEQRADVFVTDVHGIVHHARLSASGWQAYPAGRFEDLGGTFCGSLTAVSLPTSGQLHVLAVGTDGRLYHRYCPDGRTWTSGWLSLGMAQVFEPVAIATGPSRLDVFARSAMGSVIHRWWDGSWQPNDFADLGGFTNFCPSAAADAAGALEVYVRGGDDQIWTTRAAPGATFGAWQALGGTFQSAPAALPARIGQTDVFALAGAADDVTELRQLRTSARGRPSQWAPRRAVGELGKLTRLHPTLAIRTVLVSDTGGGSWLEARNHVSGAPHNWDLGTIGGNQGQYNNTIDVHPLDHRRVAIGWRTGPHLSRDGADTWSQPPEPVPPELHGDVQSVRFASDGSRLHVCTDGGVIWSADEGRTYNSEANRRLPILQLYQFSAAGSPDGRIAAALQDNGVVFTDARSPWRYVNHSDGQTVLFLQSGQLLHTSGGDVGCTFGTDGTVPLTVPGPGDQRSRGLTIHGMYAVNSPQYTNRSGQTLYAIAWRDDRLYGLFSDRGGGNIHWEFFGAFRSWRPGIGNITAASSGSGRSIMVGFNNGRIFRFVPASRAFDEMNQRPPPGGGGWISRLFMVNDRNAFAVSNRGFNGYVLRFDGEAWQAKEHGLPVQPFNGLAVDWTTTPATLFAATDSKVYRSRDNGDTWTDVSRGLPRRAHISDLDFSRESTGRRWLYAATYGRSVWRAAPD